MFSFQHELAMLTGILFIYLLSHLFMYIVPSLIQQFIILLYQSMFWSQALGMQ